MAYIGQVIWFVGSIWFLLSEEPDQPKKPNQLDPRYALSNIGLQDPHSFSVAHELECDAEERNVVAGSSQSVSQLDFQDSC